MNTPPLSCCPECGKPVPPESQHRICPACLMAQALASRTIDPGGPAKDAAPPPSPEEIAGKFPQFEITACLGRGGMGVVYKARQKSLDRWVALKILPPERVGEERFAERFEREAQTLAKLNHPNIVTVFDYGESGGLFYIVMEYVDGVNLRDLLRDGKLSAEQALAIVPPVCEALQYAHDQGIVHRDIKPENLLLDRAGRIKIADFGIASLVGAGAEGIGTPPYMAPEQAAGEVDHRADIYSLGVVLYELLTGERPGGKLEAPARRVLVDVRLDEIVLRALETEPALRYQTAGEFRTVVENAAVRPQPAPPRTNPAVAMTPEEPAGTKVIEKLGGKDSPRWHHIVALSSIGWFGSLPVLFYVADAARIANTQILGLVLGMLALPLWIVFARRKLLRWQSDPGGARWLKAWSWTGCCLAVPAIGFTAFFLHAMMNESGGWHPAPGEAVALPLIALAAVTLPGCAAALWNLAGGGRKTFIGIAMSAASAITVVVLGMSGGMAARPWLLQHKQQQAFKVHIAPEAVEGRVVIVRVFTPDPNHGREMRMVLEGPDDDPEHRTIPRGFKRQPWPEVFVFPSPSPAKQPWSDFGSAKQTLVAFVLPTEALAKEAYRKLGSGPRESGRVQPPRTFHFDLDPAKPETMTCRLFQVADGKGPSYTGSLRFSTGLIREGHPRWVEVSSRGFVDSHRNLEFTWEISTSRPAAVTLRHRTKEGGGETMDVCDDPTGTTKTFQQKINLLLYKISDTRVGMRLMNGTQPNTREFDGDFAAIARELEPLQSSGTWKTERDWDFELCRVAGHPVILRVEDPPPPTVVEKEARPLGSDDPRWVEITFEGDKKNPPFANGPQKLPGFHRFLWLLRASRPGFVKVAGPHGPPLIAPLEKSEESGLYEALYAVELVPVDKSTTEVRRALGPQKDGIQVASPFEELSKWVKESACSTNPARETESMLHRYGPVTSPLVTAIVSAGEPVQPSDPAEPVPSEPPAGGRE
jgi:predicted Ser/Thr protein kinase